MCAPAVPARLVQGRTDLGAVVGAGLGATATAGSALGGGDAAPTRLGSDLQHVDVDLHSVIYCANEIDVCVQPVTAAPVGTEPGSAPTMADCP